MTLPVAQDKTSKGQLIQKFAAKFGVDMGKLAPILKATAFKVPDRDGSRQEVSDEQMAALLIVADQYGLNPFTKEIYAFPDKSKGIVPIVGVDGWTRIMNEHPAFDGIEFRYSENVVTIDNDAKPCPEWCEAVIYRKDRSRPIVVREYLDECYRAAFEKKGNNGYKISGPWQSHTRRFLRHKATIQGARLAFGFAGIYDEEEGERIAQARVVDMTATMPKSIEAEAVDLDALDRFNAALDGAGLSEADMEAMDRFLDATAKAASCDRNTVKAEASADFNAFISAFHNWKGKQKVEASGKPQAKPTPIKLECPDRGGEPVESAGCSGCAKRTGCPAWEESDKAAA